MAGEGQHASDRTSLQMMRRSAGMRCGRPRPLHAAAAAPNLRRMAVQTGVLAQRLIDQQTARLGTLLGEFHALAEEPPEDTPAHDDLRHVRGHQEADEMEGLRWWAHRACVLNVLAAEEHLVGVRVLAAEPDRLLPLPAMALARCAYEAVVQTCWLLDVEVSTEQRMARWASRLLHDSQEPPTALDSFRSEAVVADEREKVVEGRELGQQLVTRAGFELKAKGGDQFEETARVTYRGESTSLTPNVSTCVDRFSPQQSALWPLFSGATHSRGWLVSGLEGDAATVLSSVLFPLLDTADVLTVEVSRYFGVNPRVSVARTHQQRVALMQHVRPGPGPAEGVDAYRAAGGAWPLPK